LDNLWSFSFCNREFDSVDNATTKLSTSPPPSSPLSSSSSSVGRSDGTQLRVLALTIEKLAEFLGTGAGFGFYVFIYVCLF
jgi:hypothetical protein